MSTIKNCYTLKELKIWLLFGIILLAGSNLLHAQISDSEAQKIYERSLSIQKSGMIVLGSWATLNIISGLAGTFHYKNEVKYFYQMNAAWNTINLGIAAFGIFGVMNADLSIGANEVFEEIENFDRILLINAGLDLAYIGIGAALWNRGISRQSSRVLGYGKSIVLQGGFLLVFDTLLYLIHHQQTKKIALSGLELTFNPMGFSLAF